jgi:hypothetical protein
MATLLYDPTDLRSTLVNRPWDARGSSTLKIGQVDVDVAMAAPGENTQTTNTALEDGSFTLAIAHYALQMEITYLSQITKPDGGLDVEKLAQIIVGSSTLTLTDIVAALFPSVSASVGTTTVDLDVDDIYDAMFTLHSALVPGPYDCVLYPQQINDFKNSLRGETGAIQWQQPTADMLSLKGPGFQGSWNGIQFWSCDSVNTANVGADSAGCMYGRGAFEYTEGDVSALIPYIPKVAAVENGKIFCQVDQVSDYGKMRLTGHYFPAAAIAENARACKIVTDR